MRRREIKQGDYFLLPFKGKRVDLLVRAERPYRISGHWITTDARGHESFYLLSSCQPVSPSLAKRILSAAASADRS